MRPAETFAPEPAVAPVTREERCFLSAHERADILNRVESGDPLTRRFLEALRHRVYNRVASRGLLGPGATTAWYYPAAEYLSDAALLYALFPEEKLAGWLRTVALDLARTPAYDWAGPAFRDHSEPLTGHLETAHLSWALSAVYDLAGEAFSPAEKEEIRQALAEKAIPLCRRWLDRNTHLANWRGIMTAGVVVAAAVLGEEDLLATCVPEWSRCAGAFQPDGSYGESLQYGNYLAFALMLAYESLVRRYPERTNDLDVGAYGKGLAWITSSMFYAKPLSGWGHEPRARAANFNDSAAIHRPSGDLLLHLAVRGKTETERGLARHLFDVYYAPVPGQGPHDLATFGMRNDWGFLTLPLLSYPSLPLDPQTAGIPLTTAFCNGHAFMRDAWNGKTIVAINGGGDPLYGPGHLHGDLNSFLLVHNGERLLVDPGHSCYRNLMHGLESSTQTHNTCTFLIEQEALGLQEDRAKAALLEQRSVLPRRLLVDGKAGAPVNRGNRLLLAQQQGSVSAVGAEVSAAYGAPIREFSRFWLLANTPGTSGAVLFVIDTIVAEQPVTTVWNWLVNNRDGAAQVTTGPDGLSLRRHEAALRLFHRPVTEHSRATPGHPVYAYVHDAYHVEPAQLGEGRPGSGLLYRWTETAPARQRTVVHAFALDESVAIDRWTLRETDRRFTLANGSSEWTLDCRQSGSYRLISGNGQTWTINQTNQQWTLGND